MYGAPRSEKSQTITRVTIPTAKSNYEVSPTFVRVCVRACIYIYIYPPHVSRSIYTDALGKYTARYYLG